MGRSGIGIWGGILARIFVESEINMESNDATASSSSPATSAVKVSAFSKAVALTYVVLSFSGLLLLFASLYHLKQVLASGLPLLLIARAAFFSLGISFLYVMLALHQRRNWARRAALSFWMLCLIWSTYAIVRNGVHPEPASGPLQYSNAAQVAGARFAALTMPYFMAVLEATAMYGLLREDGVVNQFVRPNRSTI
jgi:hypothetical protein